MQENHHVTAQDNTLRHVRPAALTQLFETLASDAVFDFGSWPTKTGLHVESTIWWAPLLPSMVLIMPKFLPCWTILKKCFQEWFKNHARMDPWLTKKDVDATMAAGLAATGTRRMLYFLRRAAKSEERRHQLGKHVVGRRVKLVVRAGPQCFGDVWDLIVASLDQVDTSEPEGSALSRSGSAAAPAT